MNPFERLRVLYSCYETQNLRILLHYSLLYKSIEAEVIDMARVGAQ